MLPAAREYGSRRFYFFLNIMRGQYGLDIYNHGYMSCGLPNVWYSSKVPSLTSLLNPGIRGRRRDLCANFCPRHQPSTNGKSQICMKVEPCSITHVIFILRCISISKWTLLERKHYTRNGDKIASRVVSGETIEIISSPSALLAYTIFRVSFAPGVEMMCVNIFI